MRLAARSTSIIERSGWTPRRYWAQFQLGRCCLSQGRGSEAVEALGTCIALRPDSPWAYSTRGLVYGLLGQYAEAHADLAQALRLEPEFRPARLNRGFVYYLQKKDKEAVAELDAALQPRAERRLVEAAYYRALIGYQRGDYGPALEDCTEVLEQKPGFRPAHWLRADRLSPRG